LSSETSAFILRTPGKFPKEHRLHSEHGESLKTFKMLPKNHCHLVCNGSLKTVWDLQVLVHFVKDSNVVIDSARANKH